VDGDGRPIVGVYVGALDEVRWGYPSGFWHGQVRRALGRRRWFQAAFTDGPHLTVARISDDGLGGGAFVWRANLDDGREALNCHIPGLPLANVQVGPIAGTGCDAYARLPHARLRLHRAAAAEPWRLEAFLPGAAMEIALNPERAPTPLVMIGEAGPIDGIYAQRFVGLEASGHVRLRSEKKDIKGIGWLEYANGFFPRPFAWATATISSPGFHIVLSDLDGVGGPTESAVWRETLPQAIGRARFDGWQGGPGEETPRTIHPPTELSDDGQPLTFEPRAVRELATGLGPSAVRWRFAAGWFSGQIGDKVLDRVPGLVEIRVLGN